MERLDINQKTIAWLNSAKGISNRSIEKILEYFNNSPNDLWDNFENEKNNLSFIKYEAINSLCKIKAHFEEMLLIKLKEQNIGIVTVYDKYYPEKLRHMDGSPYILYYKGRLDRINDLSIAVVGSRKATAYGKWVTEKLTGELSELGINIISGLAIGIDSIAHRTSLKSNANTFGVIGCGIDVVYPRINERLYLEIAEKGGAVLTEYPLGMQPLPNNFHARNRIISGLSDGVLVIEAREKSGTLITAGHAANQGREIFAVPGGIDSLYSKGTNALIKDGAKITTSIDDIIEEIPELRERINKKQSCDNCLSFTSNEITIINSLKLGGKTLDALSEETQIGTGELLGLITLLEMKGAVRRVSGNKFIIN
ncbi:MULTISPECIES: DNA-processing protein DprA [unclassified Sedimentibacter]|uniref:DNA-processing protein DprA n=1 Tax=unclassified Sedimentibacter TaxID=2649220 RepID=UPI0027E0E60E|nr:DNA-processing protein DprA [Sedimentibacter sp. MB35-C1]WMJ76125.1 DNA-processing protein DprA [Sedimentibacter sp. MB35-C1]